MAHARIELVAGRRAIPRHRLLEAVRGALVEALGVPEDDPLIRVVEYRPEDFMVPARHHGPGCTIVYVTMFAGRSLDTKRRLYGLLYSKLGHVGIKARDIAVVLNEVPMENWAVGGARPASETDVGFRVDV